MKILKLENVSKYYKSAETVSVGMKDVTVSFDIGEFVAITGESGSGKSTLLNVISGLDGYEDGEVYHYGEETSHFNIADWEKYRSAYIGFIFQNYNIIDSYTVYQNVMFALEVQGYPKEKRKERAYELIDKVGLTSHRHHKASKLSGGQKQRAVIARALAKDCPIIVADEPTGNLDSESSKQVMALLNEISKDKLVIVVTHDYSQIEDYATRKIKMHDGSIVEDVVFDEPNVKEEKVKAEIKKVNFLTLLKISLRNILATPKRTMFLLLLQIVVIGVFTVVYSKQVKTIRETGLTQSASFPNAPETRVLIEKRDGSAFSTAEINKFKNDKNAVAVYENHLTFYNDTHLLLSTFNGSFKTSVSYTDSSVSLSKKDVSGSLPVKLNEVVITKNDYANHQIGDTIKLLTSKGAWYPSSTEQTIGEFIITGFDKKEREIVYFSEAYLNQNKNEVQSIDYGSLADLKDSLNHSLKITFPDNSYYFMAKSNIPLDNDFEVPDFWNAELKVLTDVVGIVDFSFDRNETIVYPNLNAVVFKDANEYNGYTIHVNESVYDLIYNDFLEAFEDYYLLEDRNLLTVVVKGYYNGNQIIKTIDDDLYRVYYPANVTMMGSEFLLFINILVTVIFLGFFGLFLYTMVHAVSKNVMANRNKDFAIYRSIGASKGMLAKMVVIEQVVLNIFGFIITIILLNLLKHYSLMMDRTISYMQVVDYFVLAVVFLLFGIWIGLRFNKKVFNQSVIQVLTLSKEDL